MRRFLVVSVICLTVLAVAVPSFALEVKWGGLYRSRIVSSHDFVTALATETRDNSNNYTAAPYNRHYNRIDQRIRIFMDFISSENLKVVTKFESQAIWGSPATSLASNTGSGNVGADTGSLNVKNVYVDFKIPQTPLRAKVGSQGINLVDSWIIDDDYSAAMLEADLKPFTVALAYASGQNTDLLHEDENIDDLVAVVDFKQGPFQAAVVGLWQDAHNVRASIFPQTFDTPISGVVAAGSVTDPFTGRTYYVENNQLFDLGLQLKYKIDYLGAYLNFVKNFGSVKMGTNRATLQSKDYTGWMLDAGLSYFCGPFTANIGGFYTTGQKVDSDPKSAGYLLPTLSDPTRNADIEWFTYPASVPSKYSSEIIGGGLFDNNVPNGGYWRGYPGPTNIWTITAGGAWQALPGTKLALSYYYWGTSEKVPGRYGTDGFVKFSNYLGNEINLNITQNIVDKLNLDLVGAYMFTGDAYHFKWVDKNPDNHRDEVYELGARLQWAW